MSLVVLKRKAGTKYGKISSQSKGRFSLNNPRRVESKSGRGRVQSQTPMRGNVYRGHGSSTGVAYPLNVVQSQYVNDDAFIRDPALANNDKYTAGLSVKSHHGSIAVRHKWLKRGYPYFVTKDMHPLTYEEYNSNKSSQSAAANLGREGYICRSEDGGCNSKIVTINKRVDVMDQSEYLKTGLMNKNCLPPKNDKLPVPRPVEAHCGVGCGGEMVTPNEETEKGNCA